MILVKMIGQEYNVEKDLSRLMCFQFSATYLMDAVSRAVDLWTNAVTSVSTAFETDNRLIRVASQIFFNPLIPYFSDAWSNSKDTRVILPVYRNPIISFTTSYDMSLIRITFGRRSYSDRSKMAWKTGDRAARSALWAWIGWPSAYITTSVRTDFMKKDPRSEDSSWRWSSDETSTRIAWRSLSAVGAMDVNAMTSKSILISADFKIDTNLSRLQLFLWS